MKNKLIVTIMCLGSFSAFAQPSATAPVLPEANTSVTTIENISSKELITNKSLEVSLGYTRNELSYDGETDKIDSNGIALSFGKIFNLSNNITTTSSISGGLALFSSDELDENESAKMYELGISQRLAYNIKSGNVIIKPFLEAGILGGRLILKETIGPMQHTAAINNIRYGGALGIQVVLPNGLTPFVKYHISKFWFARNGSEKLEYNGQEIAKADYDTYQEKAIDSKTISAGIGYVF